MKLKQGKSKALSYIQLNQSAEKMLSPKYAKASSKAKTGFAVTNRPGFQWEIIVQTIDTTKNAKNLTITFGTFYSAVLMLRNTTSILYLFFRILTSTDLE